jgi:hypothetical protein
MEPAPSAMRVFIPIGLPVYRSDFPDWGEISARLKRTYLIGYALSDAIAKFPIAAL